MLPEEVKFWKDAANALKKENATVLLEYGDIHTRSYGQILEVQAGGIVFHDDGAVEGVNDFITYGKIDKMQRRPIAAGAGGLPDRGLQRVAQAAGGIRGLRTTTTKALPYR